MEARVTGDAPGPPDEAPPDEAPPDEAPPARRFNVEPVEQVTYESLPLTPIQRGLLAESLMARDKGLNVEQVVWELDFEPDVPRLRAAWQALVDGSDALRLTFAWPARNLEPTQMVRERVALPLHELDLETTSAERRLARLERFLDDDRRAGFQLLGAPLLRVTILRFAPDDFVCVWTVHHCVVDGRSFVLALQRVLASYARGGSPVLAEQPRFSDFLRWLERRDQQPGIEHFRSVLAGFKEATPLPLRQGSAIASGETARTLRRLGPDVGRLLRETAAGTGATSNTLLELAWGLLLAGYSGRDDVVFGTARAGRAGTIAGAERVIGPFIGTLPIRIQLQPFATVRSLIAALRAQHLALRPFAHTSLAEVKAQSELARAPHLFETLFVFDRDSLQASLEAADSSFRAQRVWSRSQAAYPLILAVRFVGDELELELEFDAGLYGRDTAERLLADYERLLLGACKDLEAPPWSVPLLDPELTRRLTLVEASRELIAAQPAAISRILAAARSHAGRIAVRQRDGQELSYAELAQRVLRLAAVLRRRGVGPGTFVALWLPRNIGGVVALLAVQAAGGAFVPLDTQSPLARVTELLSDFNPALLLVDQTTRGKLPELQAIELDVDSLVLRDAPPLSFSAPPADAPAYLIYTSGSTGKPKGVVVPQSALANHLTAALELFGLGPEDRVLQFAAPTFDVALEEVLPTLAAGATLVLRDEAMIGSARDFFTAIELEQLSVLNLPTAFWHQLVHADHLSWPKCLRLLIVGGERVSAESHARFRSSRTEHMRWLNGYGPTEATITSTCYDDAEGDHSAAGVPIGRPLPGVSHFVLDARLRPVPPGCVGELYIGGAGLALGYHSRAEQTAQRFVAHPWRSGARLYATGDLVCQTPSGNYVFVERPDHQVKLRGFRIELGEIEAQLRRHPAVSEAVVVLSARPGDEALLGFVIAPEDAVTPEELHEQLAAALPAHMLPARLVVTSSLPMTPSGKIDRRALAELPLNASPRRSSAPPPPSVRGIALSIVPALMQLWSELLGTEVTSTEESFFDLGGHSLLVVRLFSEVERRFGKTCNVATFFRNPTIAHLAAQLQKAERRDQVSAVQLSAGAPGMQALFFAPGLTGRAIDFVHLVQALPEDLPVIALQLHAFADAERPNETLRDAVRRVVEVMRRSQPKGPYSIAGYSAGGTFAVAIAEELASQGETTDFVGLIDCAPPSTVPMKSPLSSARRLGRLSKTVLGRAHEILEEPNAASQLWSRTVAAGRRSMARWRWPRFEHQITIDELLGKMPSFSEGELSAMQRYLDAVVTHHFGEVNADLVLFRTPLDPPEGPFEPDLGWGRVTHGRVLIEQVPGRHNRLLTPQGCVELARRLDGRLRRRSS